MSASQNTENRANCDTQESCEASGMLSMVIPCFNEAEGIQEFYSSLKRVLESLNEVDQEIIFVDDGSNDDTLGRLNEIATKDSSVRVYSLSRNFGHQIALTAGLDVARGDAVITMDSDLQHPPELIPQMIQKWRQGYDIVSAVRSKTENISWFKNRASRGFYFILNILSDTPIPQGVADFSLLSRRAYRMLQNMPERHRFLRGMISWMGFNRALLPYQAAQRAAGRSKYTLWKMITLALDATFSFSAAPLRLATRIGLIVMFLGFVYLGWILGRYFILKDLVAGWASLIGVTLILGGCQLMFIGLIGQYLARIFEEVKGRPRYIFKQTPADPGRLICADEGTENVS